jgi:hypothetical protein
VTTDKPKISEADLRQFTGSECLYQHWTKWLKYSEGVEYLAQKADAFWLIDAIASYQRDKRIAQDPQNMLQDFQLWTLKLHNGGALLWLRRDSGKAHAPVIEQVIEYTDFPLEKVTLYVENGVLCLPSER